MAEFWIVTQGSKYTTMWLNMSEWDVYIHKYAWIYDNKQGSKYVLYNTRNLEVDGCTSKENLFGQSALVMNAT